jgi:arylsulfatase A-like enzyme
MIKPGQKKDLLFGSVNIMPTLLGLCEIPSPADVQGEDLSAELLGKSNREPEAVLLEIVVPNVRTPYNAQWRAIRTREWLFAQSGVFEKGDWLLYNVKNDPYQLKNLVADPGYNGKKMELQGLLKDWREKTGDKVDLRKSFLEKNRFGSSTL